MTENPLEQAAIAIAEDEAPKVEHEISAKFEQLLADHQQLRGEVEKVHHFLTVFAEHLAGRGIDLRSLLPKTVTGDDLHPIADATPTADANTPAAAAGQ